MISNEGKWKTEEGQNLSPNERGYNIFNYCLQYPEQFPHMKKEAVQKAKATLTYFLVNPEKTCEIDGSQVQIVWDFLNKKLFDELQNNGIETPQEIKDKHSGIFKYPPSPYQSYPKTEL